MKRFLCFWACQVLLLTLAHSLQAQDDRAIFELKGSVSQVVPDVIDMGDPWMTYQLAFSPSGKLLKVNLFDINDPRNGSYELKRDGSGRIVELSSVEGEGLRVIRYRYDAAGRVTGQDWLYDNIDFDEVIEMGGTSISYDKDGNKVKVTIKYPDGRPSETVTYTYLKFDEAGNWTSRKMTRPGQYENHTETRTIRY